MRSKILIGALLLAVLMTMVVAMSASAAPPPHFKGQAVSAHQKAANVKFVGTTQFKASPNKPLARDSATQKKLAQFASKVNRALPGKAVTGKAPKISDGTPTVSPSQIGGVPTSGLSDVLGLNSWDSAQANGFGLEPPDQGLCVGNGFVVEPINVVLAVYSTSLTKLTGDMMLNEFFGLAPDVFTSDPKCYYDPGSKRFFMTMLSIQSVGGTGAPKQPGLSFFVNLAVSETSNPLLGWSLYEIDTTLDCPSDDCLPDQPLLGANRDGIFISANMFSWNQPLFFGSNVYVLDKPELVAGALPFLINGFFIQMCDAGFGDCSGETPVVLYSLQPAFSPSAGAWDNRMGGIEYLLGAYDFFGEGDTAVTIMAITNTTSLHGQGIPDIGLYLNDVGTEAYIVPWDWAMQKDDGLIPYGQVVFGATVAGPIQPNDDRMNQVVYANHVLWSGVNTMLWQQFKGKPSPVAGVHTVTRASFTYELHVGIAWWGIRPQWTKAGNLIGTMVKQGYIAPAHEDALFPSIGMSDLGKGAMAFTLTGMDYYPSAAWVRVNATDGASRVFFSAKGRGSYDSYCEYDLSGNCSGAQDFLRPRWGDYSAAVANGGKIYLASEYIQSPNCNVTAWLADNTCGGTRNDTENWGTSLSDIVP